MSIDLTSQFLIAGIAILTAGIVMIIGLKRFELAVAGIAFSPFLAAVLALISSEGELTAEETIGSYVRIGLIFLMGSIGLIKFLHHQTSRAEKLPLPLKFLGAFLILAVFSTSYSIDWYYTLIRSLSFMALFAFLLGLYAWLNDPQRRNKVFYLLFFVLLVILIANAASLVLLRESAWWIKNPSRFIGLLGHPNTLGAFCMVCYPIALWRMAQVKSWRKLEGGLFILVAAGLHLITGSRSSILAGLVGMLTWFFVTRQRIKPIVLSVFIAALVMVLIETTPIERSFERTVNTERSVTTLTGRSEFWMVSLELIKERPLLGYGFGTAGKILAESELHNPDIRLWSGSAKTSLHNGYLTIASGTGTFGFILWIVLLLMPVWWLRQLRPLSLRAVVLAVMISCLLLNFAEDAIDAGTSLPALIFWMAWVTALRTNPQEAVSFP